MGQEPRILTAAPVDQELGEGRWSDRELAELHAAALGVGARAARVASTWGAPARPDLSSSRAAPRVHHGRLIGRALADVPLYLFEAFALCWPILVVLALLSLRLGAADPFPPELRRGASLVVLAFAVPTVLYEWMRQRGGRAQPMVLGTLLRLGPRELTAVLVLVPIIAAAALIGTFFMSLSRAFGAAPLWQSVGWALAAALFVQWSTLVAAFAREDDRSPLTLQRDILHAMPALLIVALPLALIGFLAGSGAVARIMSGPLAGALDVRLIGWTALMLIVTMSYGSALAYVVEATARRAD